MRAGLTWIAAAVIAVTALTAGDIRAAEGEVVKAQGPLLMLASLPSHCPPFRMEGSPIAVVACRVTEWGEFADVAGDVYYYALYCVEDKDLPESGSCDAPESSNSRYYQRGSAAIFVGRRGSDRVRLLTAVWGAGGNFGKPKVVTSADGRVMELPLIISAVCDCNSSFYYHYEGRTRSWRSMDWDRWSIDLVRRLPAGLSPGNDVWPDLRTLRGEGYLWKREDSHAKPTGGRYHVQLGIEHDRFVLKSLQIIPQ